MCLHYLNVENEFLRIVDFLLLFQCMYFFFYMTVAVNAKHVDKNYHKFFYDG